LQLFTIILKQKLITKVKKHARRLGSGLGRPIALLKEGAEHKC